MATVPTDERVIELRDVIDLQLGDEPPADEPSLWFEDDGGMSFHLPLVWILAAVNACRGMSTEELHRMEIERFVRVTTPEASDGR